jgi:alanyl-tRNA synthetase
MKAKPFSGAQIRQSFLEHYAQKGHVIVPSSSLVPDNDPTLMFANSGMVQFKNNFTGVDTRLQRAVSVQRCVRAGGKHNDLENVGQTARHHTFFEMMGNFSFGDYFKRESLTWGWQWVTETLGLDPARMCVTVYHDDDEAVAIWKSIGMADKDIIRINSSANFWTMGDTGPCGPCSEIFYDLDPTGQVWGGRPGTPEEDGDRWMEIWNHVFTQFDLQLDGSKQPLKAKNIDTGAGLERVLTAVQGVFSNYETDAFQPIIKAAGSHAGVTYGRDEGHDFSLRVIADHLRAMSFLTVDGVLPGNEGRGYVMRRIMRRAMRHGHFLGVEKPFIHQLVPTLVGLMGEAYPELQRGAGMVMDVVKAEEERFGRTLKQGMSLLDEATKTLKAGDMLAGEVAFKLYDTYGFPLDLTEDALRAREIHVNLDGFQAAMAEQKQRARAAHKGSGDSKLADHWFGIQAEVGNTEFLGYTTTSAEGQVLALANAAGRVQALQAGEQGVVIVNQTPFYAESGGQVGDTGVLRGDGCVLTVTDTQKVLDGLWLHSVTVKTGQVTVGTNLEMQVDVARRAAITRNHTVTHILFAGLRDLLGTHVVQRGSRQDEHVTRFDFSHPKGLTADELLALEQWVNERIWQNLPVVTRVLDKDTAVASGATAQFGEKYGDDVRVVSIGNPDSVQMLTADLCGGTHVGQTGEIGLFRVLSEGSVSSGVRRLEAVTHMAAWQDAQADRMIINQLRNTFKTKRDEVLARVEQAGKKQASAGDGFDGAGVAKQLLAQLKTVGGKPVLVVQTPAIAPANLQTLLKEHVRSANLAACFLISEHDGRSHYVAAVQTALAAEWSATQLVQTASGVLNGKGGGRPDFASGSGEVANIPAALKAVEQQLSA